MKLSNHLDIIYKLVLDRADPAVIREHIEFIRDQVEAAGKIEAKLRKQITRDKRLHANAIAKVNNDFSEFRKLIRQFDKKPSELAAMARKELRLRGESI